MLTRPMPIKCGWYKQIDDHPCNLFIQHDGPHMIVTADGEIVLYDQMTGRPVTQSNQTNDTQAQIASVCDDLKDFLIEKNIAYGNSALNPIRIFSKSDTKEQLLVRIDDKLNRIKNGKDYAGDDDILDLTGYLILLMVARRNDAGISV